MVKLLTKALLAVTATVLLGSAGDVLACSCFPLPPPYRAYREADAVFIGKVTSSKDVPYEELVRDKKFTVHDRHFLFSVEEALKGTKGAEIDINVGKVDSSCYQGFTAGEVYLVYAYANSAGGLSSGACTRTSHVKHAFDDLHYLRALLKGSPEPRLYGAVVRLGNDLAGNATAVDPVEGIKIVVEGEKRRFEATTDKRGLYTLYGIPDGRYKVRPLLPSRYMSYFFADEEFVLGPQEGDVYPRVQAGPSAYARFLVGWNNGVSGRVLDAEGHPVERAVVRLVPVGRASEPLPPMYENIADHLGKDGKYHIYGKTPGRYLLAAEVYAPLALGVNPARTYYPQAATPDKAEVISVGESGNLSLDIKLLPGQVTRQIEGVVLWSDGTPVGENGNVFLEKLEDPEDKTNVKYDLERVGGGGRFTIQAFEGGEYWLHARVGTLGLNFGKAKNDLWDSGVQELKSQPIRLKVGRSNAQLRIIIPLPEGSVAPTR
jgi:hypothetical protein